MIKIKSAPIRLRHLPPLRRGRKEGRVRHQPEAIARAVLAMVMAPESIALHRLLTSGTISPKLVQLFRDVGRIACVDRCSTKRSCAFKKSIVPETLLRK